MTWEELIAKRVPLKDSSRSSGHLLENIQIVRSKFPEADVVAEGNSWKLAGAMGAITNAHPCHYDCWLEARQLIELSNS